MLCYPHPPPPLCPSPLVVISQSRHFSSYTTLYHMILSNLPAITLSDLHLGCRHRGGRRRLLNLDLHYSHLSCSSSPSETRKFTSNLTMRVGSHTHTRVKPQNWASIPARDRVIDFGKYRGKMLGTLPSKYLRWISKNLRARDFEEWSRLADEVLQDPIYKDRIEWEFAEGVLNGNSAATAARTESAVSELLEISERFGWDNQDKAGWSRVNFELLGTSKGGRIPRRPPADRKDDEGPDEAGGQDGDGARRDVALSEDERRRRERRERLRLRLKRSDSHRDIGERRWIGVFGEAVKKRDPPSSSSDSGSDSSSSIAEEKGVYNPFPGRHGLLKKILRLNLNRRRSP